MNSWQQPTAFEQYVNPVVGELTRRIGLDKQYVRGDGCHLFDEQGRAYLDFLAAYGALPFGHGPAELMQVLVEHAASGEPNFVQPSSLVASGELAAALLAIAPGNLRSVTFQNSGAETVEAAIKACRVATGRAGILSMRNSFHGKTLGALSATGSDKYQEGFHTPLPGFAFVDFGDAAAVRERLAAAPEHFAAVIVEPIQGEGGINVPPADYLQQLREACDAYGVLLIIDEIQTGLGRTGKLFASEGVRADCLLLAKALGGGVMPIGACLLGENAYSEAFQTRHSSTFGGNTLACRIGLKALEMIRRPGLIDAVASNGRWLLEQLQALASRYPFIAQVRGKGYLIGIEFALTRQDFAQFHGAFLGLMAEQQSLVPVLASYLLNVEGIRVAPTLNGASVMRVEPPLIAGRQACEAFIEGLSRCLALLAEGQTGALLAHLVGAIALPVAQPAQHGQHWSFAQPASGEHAAFILHPLDLANYAEFDESLGHFGATALQQMQARLNPLLEPFFVSTVALRSASAGQAATVDLIMLPRSAEQMAELPVEDACALVRQAIDMARQRGATRVGLGGHTSIVTGGGLRLADAGMDLTTGNSYTLLTAIEAAALAVERTGRRMQDMHVAVVGASGSIGSAAARLMAAQAGRLTLVGNPQSARFNGPRFISVIKRILQYARVAEVAPGSVLQALAPPLDEAQAQALAQQLYERNSSPLHWSNDLNQALAEADVVLVATSSANRFIEPGAIRPGAILCDISRPANVSLAVAEERPDVLVLDGGIVSMPGDARLGSRYGIPDDLTYACMAETMMLALGRHRGHASLGLDLEDTDLALVQRLAREHGFALAGLRSFDRAMAPHTWQRYAAQFAQAVGEMA